MLVLILGASFGLAQSLDAAGACPAVTWSADGLTPGGSVVLMASARTGATRLPAGPCAGAWTGLGALVSSHTLRVDDVGGWLQATALAGDECRLAYQLLDVATCRVSNVVRIQQDRGVLAGSYAVRSGRPWSEGAAPVSCLGACAAQFGGQPADYWCSTNDRVVDHLAFLDSWGDDRVCHDPQPEDHAAGESTRCAGEGCYASAWVDDHGCDAVNYCWLR